MNADQDSLFGDMGIPEVIVNKVDRRTAMIDEAWSLWVAVTNRPSNSQAPDRFATLYRELLRLKYPHERLLRCVRAAAHLPPRSRDPQDLRRVLAVLDNENTEAEAISLLDQGDAPIYLWEWDEKAKLCSAKDIALHCNTEVEYWTPKEHQSAGVIITSITPDRLEMAAKRVKLHLGQESIFPSEIIRNSFVWRNPETSIEVKAVPGRDTYDSGKSESEALDGLDLELDEQSEALLLKGCPANLVRQFHLQAPDGYWGDVLTQFEENEDLTLKDIYRDLESQYEWSPSERDRPQW